LNKISNRKLDLNESEKVNSVRLRDVSLSIFNINKKDFAFFIHHKSTGEGDGILSYDIKDIFLHENSEKEKTYKSEYKNYSEYCETINDKKSTEGNEYSLINLINKNIKSQEKGNEIEFISSNNKYEEINNINQQANLQFDWNIFQEFLWLPWKNNFLGNTSNLNEYLKDYRTRFSVILKVKNNSKIEEIFKSN